MEQLRACHRNSRTFPGVVVQDCLSVLLNLLKSNPSNQSYFRESSFIRRLVDCFELQSIGDKRWSPQKVTNIHLLLQVRLRRGSRSSEMTLDVSSGHSNVSLTDEFQSKYNCMPTNRQSMW